MADPALVIHLVVIGVALAAVLSKLADLVRRPRPGLWALWASLVVLLVALVVGLVSVGGVVDAVVPGGGWVLQHLLVLGGSFALQVFFLCSVHPEGSVRPRALRRAAVTGAGMVLVGAAWAVAQATEHPVWAEFDWRAWPWSAAANLLWVAWIGVSLVATARLAGRWALIADRRWLRRGLLLLSAGCWVLLGYTVHRVAYIAAEMLGAPPPWDQRMVEILLIAAGVALGLTGVTLPAWAPHFPAARRWWRQYRSHRRLAPLWTVLHSAEPSIALPSPAPWWRVEYRLYRRVIEIWDGRAAVRAHLDPDLARAVAEAAEADGLTGDDLAAAVEAEVLRAAVRARLAGRGPVSPGVAPARQGGADLAAEVAWLARVARVIGAPDRVRWPGDQVGATVGADTRPAAPEAP